MKFNELIDMCVKIVQSYSPSLETEDTYADQFLEKIVNLYEKTFIKQIFTGYNRYRNFLKSFNECLFKVHGSSTSRNDAILYGILAYITLFRLDELSHDDYKRIVTSQDSVKINVFLQFIFNPEQLIKHCRPLWVKEFDYSYVDDTIIKGIEKNITKVSDILAKIEKKATGKTTNTQSISITESAISASEETAAKPEKKVTVPMPFKLSEGNKKKKEASEIEHSVFKPQPFPKEMCEITMKDIDKKNKERKEQSKLETLKKYEGVEVKLNKDAELIEAKKKDLIEKVAEEKYKEIEKTRAQFKLPPKTEPPKQEIKMTAASILREEVLLKKKEAEEKAKIANIEQNLHDASEFERWQKEMKQKDNIERKEQMEMRKIEMKMSKDEQLKAVEHKMKENQLLAEKMKVQSAENAELKQKKIAEELEKKKEVVEEISAIKDVIREEQEKVYNQKKEIKQKVKEEIEAAIQRKKEAEAEEQKRREEIIRQIRELDWIPKENVKEYDPRETMGYGLLEEMSLAELKERLDNLKVQKENEILTKKNENIKKKEEYKCMIEDKKTKILDNRSTKEQQYSEKKAKEKQEKAEKQEKEKQLSELQRAEAMKKIEKKHKQKQKEQDALSKELREIKLKRQYLNANKEIMEAKAWKELDNGAERVAANSQNKKLITQHQAEKVKLTDTNLKAKSAKVAVEKKVNQIKTYEKEYQRRIKENEEEHKQDILDRTEKHGCQREFEQKQMEKYKAKNQYSEKHKEEEVDDIDAKLNSENK